MKKILLILASIILTQSAIAQTALNEGFEAWPPTDWEFYILGTALDGWRDDFNGNGHTGTGSAYSSIDNNQSDNWMVTPAIMITNDNYQLKFWEIHASIEYYNRASVLISSGNGDPSNGDFVEIFESNILNTVAWEERAFDLTAYNGQTIYVAFRHEGTYHSWNVDDVTISPSSFIDGALIQFLSPLGVSETPTTAPVIIRIKNTGTEVINNFDIAWDVNSVAQPTSNTTGLNLQPGQSANINIGSYNFNSEGAYNIVTNLILVDDFDDSNNQIQNTFEISSFKDGAIISITPEGMIPNAGSIDVKATVSNLGENTINVAEILWSVDGIEQIPYTSNILNLIPGESITLTLGQYAFTNGLQTITATLNVTLMTPMISLKLALP
jgi:hypothetical protein